MSVKDIIEAEAKAAEAAEGGEPVRDLSEVSVKRGRERTEVLQVRLNRDEYEAVKAAAGDLPVSTYARAVLLRAISPALETSARDAAERGDLDLATLRNVAALLHESRVSMPDFHLIRPVDFSEVAVILTKTLGPLEARVEALEKHSA